MSEKDYNARLYEKMKAEQDKYRLPFCTCYDIIGMRTKTFGERRYICGETAVKQRGKY